MIILFKTVPSLATSCVRLLLTRKLDCVTEFALFLKQAEYVDSLYTGFQHMLTITNGMLECFDKWCFRPPAFSVSIFYYWGIILCCRDSRAFLLALHALCSCRIAVDKYIDIASRYSHRPSFPFAAR